MTLDEAVYKKKSYIFSPWLFWSLSTYTTSWGGTCWKRQFHYEVFFNAWDMLGTFNIHNNQVGPIRTFWDQYKVFGSNSFFIGFEVRKKWCVETILSKNQTSLWDKNIIATTSSPFRQIQKWGLASTCEKLKFTIITN